MKPEPFDFRAYLTEISNKLRARVPASKPVKVRIQARRASRSFGTCALRKTGCSINIYLRVLDGLDPTGRGVTPAEARDTLLHEWAHAIVMCRTATSDAAGHSDRWGKAYARCYRALEDN